MIGLLILVGSNSDVYAINPALSGRVVHSVTGAPIPNVWLKLTTAGCNFCACAQQQRPAVRYVQADSSGRYTFAPIYSWTGGYDPNDVGRLIDTNFDGTNDSVVLEDHSSPTCIEPTYGSAVHIGEFGCGTVPQTIEVVRPVYLPGTFSRLDNIVFPNAQSDFTIGLDNIVYYPVGGTPTISTTITGASITSTPRPSITSGPISCSFTVPSSIDITLGAPFTFSPSVNQVGGTVDDISFSIANSSVASVCASGTCAPGLSNYVDFPGFQASITGYSAGGSTTLSLSGRMRDEGVTCTTTVPIRVNVLNTAAWCQFKEADVITNGNLSCPVPSTCAVDGSCDNNVLSNDVNTDPGVAIADGSISTGFASLSQTNWKADSRHTDSTYSVEYFLRKASTLPILSLPSNIVTTVSNLTTGVQSGGYYWVSYTGSTPLEFMSNMDFGNNKVVLFVPNADLKVNGKISVNDGRGFFMAIVGGDILVNPTVGGAYESTPIPDIEGVYFTENQFKTGTNGLDSDVQLHVRGSVAALDRIDMERSLVDNSTTPSELFEFGPDQLMLFPQVLGDQNINWREVAP